MTKVYLHIGLPKTGTTAIQNWLIANASNLRKANVFTFDDVYFSHRLAVAALKDKAQEDREDTARIVKYIPLTPVTDQLGKVAGESIQTIILSSEYFYHADPERVKQLFFEAQLHDVSIVLVLRRQDRLMESGYCQGIMAAGRTHPIGPPAYNPLLYDWYALTRAWAGVFSPNAMLLHTYERVSADGRIVERVIGSLEPRVADVMAANPPPKERTNASLPAALIEFKRIANQAGATDILPFLERVAQNGIGGASFRMNTTLAKAFLDLYRESNRRLNQEFFGGYGELFDEQDLQNEGPGSDFSGRFPIEILAALLAFHLQEVHRAKADFACVQAGLEMPIQPLNSKYEGIREDLLSLTEKIDSPLAQASEQRVRPNAIISKHPLEAEIKAQAERWERLRKRIERLEDLVRPRGLVQMFWKRLITRTPRA